MGTLQRRTPDLVAVIENLAFAQPKPFTTVQLTDMATGATGFNVSDVDEILEAYRGVVRVADGWCSLRAVAQVHHTATAHLGSRHVASTPREAIDAAYSSQPQHAPTVLELATVFLERSPDVARHPTGQLAIPRRTLPDLSPSDPGDAAVSLNLGYAGGTRSSARSARDAIRNWLAMPRLRLLTLRTHREHLRVVRAAPVALGKQTALVAWTPPLTAARAERLSALGWWIWPNDEPEIVKDARLLADMRPLAPGTYRAAVTTAGPLTLGTLMSATLALDYQEHATQYELTTATAAPRGFFASSEWRKLQDGVRNPVLGHCAACDSPLSDPGSARRGIGPVCFERLVRHLGAPARLHSIIDDLKNERPIWTGPLSVADWRTMLVDELTGPF